MTPEQFAILHEEITVDPLGRNYSSMPPTGEAIADSLNAINRKQVFSRFISLRAMANEMTDVEYDTFMAMFDAASLQSRRVADMFGILKIPCGDDGTEGGLDFGCDGVRDKIDMFSAIDGMAEAAARLKALAERTISRAEELGLDTIFPAHVRRVLAWQS